MMNQVMKSVEKRTFSISLATAISVAIFIVIGAYNFAELKAKFENDIVIINYKIDQKADNSDYLVLDTRLKSIDALLVEIKSKLK